MPKWRNVIAPFNTWQYLLLNIVLGSAFVLVFRTGNFETLQSSLISLLWSSLIWFTLWTGNAYVVHFLDPRIKWIDQPVKRAIVGLVLQSFYSLFAFISVQMLMLWIFFGRAPGNLWTWIVEFGTFPVVISLSISAFFTAVGFFRAWRNSESKARAYEKEMLTYKYEALRNQINPHFLFNSFNVLSDLVHDEPDTAVTFIQQLSELYRYVLDSREKELVPLQSELDLLKSYNFLLKTRFEEKLQIEIDVETKEGEMIVPMALQLLVENAVKHNEVSRSRPLTVNIRRKGDRIEVSNNLQVKQVGEDSKKTGLKNLQGQYAFFSERKLEISPGPDHFSVSIPILKHQSA